MSFNIVLDLDETLVYTHEESDKSGSQRIEMMNYDHELGNENIAINYTILRPFALEFIRELQLISSHIIVWSAGVRKYVEEIVELLFPNKPPSLILARENCFIDDKKGIIRKPLSQIIDSEFGQRERITFSNTLVVDDRSDTFSLNPNNGILIPGFTPRCSLNFSVWRGPLEDRRLYELFIWLEEVKGDVRVLDKQNIFRRLING